jgi:uncharacterized cupin superfamily protein
MTKDASKPEPPTNIDAVPWQPWSEGERFACRMKVLSDTQNGARIGVAVEELPPGKQLYPAHYHMLEEEHIFILEGELTLRLGEERHSMKKGDYVRFPAGQAVGHCLLNEGSKPCQYLVIGDHNPNEVCVYTDSNKVLVRSLQTIFDATATRGYWDGEDT